MRIDIQNMMQGSDLKQMNTSDNNSLNMQQENSLFSDILRQLNQSSQNDTCFCSTSDMEEEAQSIIEAVAYAKEEVSVCSSSDPNEEPVCENLLKMSVKDICDINKRISDKRSVMMKESQSDSIICGMSAEFNYSVNELTDVISEQIHEDNYQTVSFNETISDYNIPSKASMMISETPELYYDANASKTLTAKKSDTVIPDAKSEVSASEKDIQASWSVNNSDYQPQTINAGINENGILPSVVKYSESKEKVTEDVNANKFSSEVINTETNVSNSAARISKVNISGFKTSQSDVKSVKAEDTQPVLKKSDIVRPLNPQSDEYQTTQAEINPVKTAVYDTKSAKSDISESSSANSEIKLANSEDTDDLETQVLNTGFNQFAAMTPQLNVKSNAVKTANEITVISEVDSSQSDPSVSNASKFTSAYSEVNRFKSEISQTESVIAQNSEFKATNENISQSYSVQTEAKQDLTEQNTAHTDVWSVEAEVYQEKIVHTETKPVRSEISEPGTVNTEVEPVKAEIPEEKAVYTETNTVKSEESFENLVDTEVRDLKAELFEEHSAQIEVKPAASEQKPVISEVHEEKTANTEVKPVASEVHEEKTANTEVKPVASEVHEENIANTEAKPVASEVHKEKTANTEVKPVISEVHKEKTANTEVKPVISEVHEENSVYSQVKPVISEVHQENAVYTQAKPVLSEISEGNSVNAQVKPVHLQASEEKSVYTEVNTVKPEISDFNSVNEKTDLSISDINDYENNQISQQNISDSKMQSYESAQTISSVSGTEEFISMQGSITETEPEALTGLSSDIRTGKPESGKQHVTDSYEKATVENNIDSSETEDFIVHNKYSDSSADTEKYIMSDSEDAFNQKNSEILSDNNIIDKKYANSVENNDVHTDNIVRDKNTDSVVREEYSEVEEIIQHAVILNRSSFAYNSDILIDENLTEKKISDQTLNALEKNIVNKKDEFVIKLTPDGLGDITVKLIRTEDEIVVKMIASSEKTSQILNRELGILQNVLGHHNAHIQTVEYRAPQQFYNYNRSSSNSNSMQYSSQSDEYADNADGRRSQQNYHNFIHSQEDEEIVQTMPVIIGNTILNRYI